MTSERRKDLMKTIVALEKKADGLKEAAGKVQAEADKLRLEILEEMVAQEISSLPYKNFSFVKKSMPVIKVVSETDLLKAIKKYKLEDRVFKTSLDKTALNKVAVEFYKEEKPLAGVSIEYEDRLTVSEKKEDENA